jgi:uncharacterized damage-inducible protein DinB
LSQLLATNVALETENKKYSKKIAAQRTQENEVSFMYEDNNIAALRSEYDYRTTYVNRLNEEIAKEENRKKQHTDDEGELDVLTAESDAVIAWFKEKLAVQTEIQADAKLVW